jgi:hypothetical protein
MPGVLNIAGFQRYAQPLLAEVGQMDGEMAPEGAMVIPQMVVGVAGLATDGQFCFSTHTMRAFCWRARTRRGMKTKRPSFTSRRHQVFRENTLIEEPPRVPPHLPGTFVPARAPLPSHQGQEAGSRACAQTAPDADSQITVRILPLAVEHSTSNCVIKRPNHWSLWIRRLMQQQALASCGSGNSSLQVIVIRPGRLRHGGWWNHPQSSPGAAAAAGLQTTTRTARRF